MQLAELYKKALNFEFLSIEEGVFLFENAPLAELMNIANELRHQYNLFYRPEPLKNDGLYHKVQIKVRKRGDVIVRARKGYYASRGNPGPAGM